MEMSAGDVMDRYTILRLKKLRLPLDLEVERELETCRSEMDRYQAAFALRDELFEVNKQIWGLEAEIRAGKEGAFSLEEIGRRALAIRDWNGKRVGLKNRINRLFGAPLERKVEHCSA